MECYDIMNKFRHEADPTFSEQNGSMQTYTKRILLGSTQVTVYKVPFSSMFRDTGYKST